MTIYEFDEYGNVFTGIEATKRKLTYEFSVEQGEIPFSDFGSKVDPFLLNNSQAWQIQTVLSRYGMISDFVLTQGRLALVDASIVIDLSGNLNTQSTVQASNG